MEVLKTIGFVLESLLLLYFGFAALYIFVFASAGLFPARKRNPKLDKPHRFAVLIPGYKEDNVIVEVAEHALRQNYPNDSFEVVVIADSFQPKTLNALKELPIRLVEVSFEKSTKSKALNKAMETIGDGYDIALVLDADNLMERDFLTKMNQAFNSGFRIVQGHRIAKNQNTPMAILDAISEEINNHIFRKGHRVLGLSSALIGSGMAFDYTFFKEMMANVNAVGGFDKELELKLLRDGNTIEYLNDAYVLDEKVQKSEVFANQRKRWLSAQFVYFRRYVLSGLKELFLRGNVDFADKVYQMVSPPRVLLLGLVMGFTTLYALVESYLKLEWLQFSPTIWYGIAGITVLAFLFATPTKFYRVATFKAMATLPSAFFTMFLSLFKLKGANKKFIHTQHGTPNS
ncbi:MAG: glycosyltransferase [Bacteroidota bacterium]